MGRSPDWPSTHSSIIEWLQQESGGPAWDLFADVYVPLIFGFCRRRGVQDADAQDVTQSVFLLIRKGIPRLVYDPVRGKFRSWLGTITSREIRRHQHQLHRAGTPTLAMTNGEAIEGENDAGWVAAFNSHVLQAALTRIQSDFEELTWKAFELLWFDDLKPAEVAARSRMSTAWVYQVKFRVLRRLEKEVRFLTADMAAFAKD